MERYKNYKAFKGNILYSQDKDTLISEENSYILVLDGVVKERARQARDLGTVLDGP